MHDRTFLQLCIGEIGVVSIGQVSLPAAVIVQAAVVLVIFRASFTRQDLGAVAVFLPALAVFSWMAWVQGHALPPLLILGGTAGLALLIFSFAGYRLRRRSGGPA